jgi:hypothetical protein
MRYGVAEAVEIWEVEETGDIWELWVGEESLLVGGFARDTSH